MNIGVRALPSRGGTPLWWTLALALVLRLAIAAWPVFHHPDELWQYLEPARHVAGRPWIATWEARAGARGWLLPVLFAGPMWLGQWLAPGTFLAILMARLLCVAVAMIGVVAATGLGFRVSRAHGLVAAFVAAIWPEWVYFGARTLSEPIATALILAAACLLGDRRLPPRLAAGLVLGLACAIRFQYAPAAAVLAAWTLRRDGPAWTAVIAGGIAGLAASAAADLAMGAAPFAWAWAWRNLAANLVENRSADYGTSPPWWYAIALWRTWGPGGAVVLVLAVLGARRYPALAAAALANLLVHALIPHKEARFILLTTSLTVLLAAIGSVDVARRWRMPRRPAVLAAGWLALACVSGVWAAQSGWGKYGRLAAAWRSAAGVPGLCGIGIHHTLPLVASHALLARDVPLYQYEDTAAVAMRRSRAFDVLVTGRAGRSDAPRDYALVACSGTRPRDLCVLARPGACAATPWDARHAVNRTLERLDY